MSIRLNHLFPLTPCSRAASIFSLQTPRWALWRCHRSSPPGLSSPGTRGGGSSRRLSLEAFAFLPPFAPPVVTRLRSAVPGPFPASVFPRLACATTAALTPAGRAVSRASCPGRPPAFTALSFPDLLPPTTRPYPARLCVAVPHRSMSSRTSRLRRSLAGSSCWLCRIVFTFVAVDLVPSVAPHPASRRRGYFRFSSAQRQPMAGVSHPGRVRSSAAHEGSAPSLPEHRRRGALQNAAFRKFFSRVGLVLLR